MSETACSTLSSTQRLPKFLLFDKPQPSFLSVLKTAPDFLFFYFLETSASPAFLTLRAVFSCCASTGVVYCTACITVATIPLVLRAHASVVPARLFFYFLRCTVALRVVWCTLMKRSSWAERSARDDKNWSTQASLRRYTCVPPTAHVSWSHVRGIHPMSVFHVCVPYLGSKCSFLCLHPVPPFHLLNVCLPYKS